MILEGIVTSLSPEGTINIAPMGPVVDARMTTLLLKPFNTSHTYRNLKDHGEGVFHVTDDVLLLAKAAIGDVEPTPDFERAEQILGYALTGACRYYEFRVVRCDESTERVVFEAKVVNSVTRRDFFGFNRAKHAVLEAAILATRTSFLPLDDMACEFAKLDVIVKKTGGPAEFEAFALLQNHLNAEVTRRRGQAP